MTSLVDGAASSGGAIERGKDLLWGASEAQRKAMEAFDSLSNFLRTELAPPLKGEKGGGGASRLGLLLMIKAVEPLSPCLRYSEFSPPLPHPLLGGDWGSGGEGGIGGKGEDGKMKRKVLGAIATDPVLIQIRFEGSSKWQLDVQAMAAAKCAMLVQLADGVERMKRNGEGRGCSEFGGPMDATPRHADFGYMGYLWRVLVRAD